MADRIRKRKNRDGSSTQRRRRLAEFSSSSGFLMPKCSYCHEHGLDCHVSGTSNRCGPCNRVNRPSCDVWGLDPGTFRSFLSEKDKLDREEEETLAKLLRLRKQKRALEERVKKAVSRELRDISELEREEGLASLIPSGDSSSNALSAQAVPGPSVFSSLDPALLDHLVGFDWSAGPSFLGDQGVVGGTPSTSQDSGGS